MTYRYENYGIPYVLIHLITGFLKKYCRCKNNYHILVIAFAISMTFNDMQKLKNIYMYLYYS